MHGSYQGNVYEVATRRNTTAVLVPGALKTMKQMMIKESKKSSQSDNGGKKFSWLPLFISFIRHISFYVFVWLSWNLDIHHLHHSANVLFFTSSKFVLLKNILDGFSVVFQLIYYCGCFLSFFVYMYFQCNLIQVNNMSCPLWYIKFCETYLIVGMSICLFSILGYDSWFN